jgi:IS6 family transposase
MVTAQQRRRSRPWMTSSAPTQQFEPPAACHVTEQYANNSVEADHGHLKARLRPIRVLKRFSSAQVISTVHAFVQNLHRGHYELGMDIAQRHQLTAIFTELAGAI